LKPGIACTALSRLKREFTSSMAVISPEAPEADAEPASDPLSDFTEREERTESLETLHPVNG